MTTKVKEPGPFDAVLMLMNLVALYIGVGMLISAVDESLRTEHYRGENWFWLMLIVPVTLLLMIPLLIVSAWKLVRKELPSLFRVLLFFAISLAVLADLLALFIVSRSF